MCVSITAVILNHHESKSSSSNSITNDRVLELEDHWDVVYESCLSSKTSSSSSSKCKEECQISKCCFLPSNRDDSCINTDNTKLTEICNNYYSTACYEHFETITVKSDDVKKRKIEKASSTIDEACSNGNIKTLKGFLQCTKECMQGSCCFTSNDDDNCAEENKDVCSGYSTCNNIHYKPQLQPDLFISTTSNIDDASNAQTTTEMELSSQVAQEEHHSISISLDDACKTNNNIKLCQDMCQVSSCCFTSNGCTNDSNIDCIDYQPCLILHQQQDNNAGVTSSTTNSMQSDNEEITISKACSSTNSNDLTLCKDMCLGANCCFDNSSDECKSFDTNMCSYFQPCSIVYENNINNNNNDKLLSDICSLSNISTSREGKELCEKKCYLASCCFEDSIELNCKKDNEEFCNDFKSCSILYDTFHHNNVDSSTSTIAMVPKPDANLNTNISPPSNTINQQTISSQSIPITTKISTKDYIDNVCALPSFNMNNDQQKLCQETCNHAKCCFDTNPLTTCSIIDEEFCYDYSSCSIVFTNPTPAPPKTTSNSALCDACSKENTSNYVGLQTCKQKFRIAECCFLNAYDSNYCGSNDADFCNELCPCHLLN